ncbi:hypothetical protein [Lysobacter gummosus]|uniref:hypothetical protein n=1 Tax=Lysobacter gummosus TaxID=262324 RepID=UPI003644FF6F
MIFWQSVYDRAIARHDIGRSNRDHVEPICHAKTSRLSRHSTVHCAARPTNPVPVRMPYRVKPERRRQRPRSSPSARARSAAPARS